MTNKPNCPNCGYPWRNPGRPKLSESRRVIFTCPDVNTARWIINNIKDVIRLACKNIGRDFEDGDIRTNKRAQKKNHTSRDVWFTCKKDVGDWILENRDEVITFAKVCESVKKK